MLQDAPTVRDVGADPSDGKAGRIDAERQAGIHVEPGRVFSRRASCLDLCFGKLATNAMGREDQKAGGTDKRSPSVRESGKERRIRSEAVTVRKAKRGGSGETFQVHLAAETLPATRQSLRWPESPLNGSGRGSPPGTLFSLG